MATCKYCHQSSLEWVHIGGFYRLRHLQGGNLHKCEAKEIAYAQKMAARFAPARIDRGKLSEGHEDLVRNVNESDYLARKRLEQEKDDGSKPFKPNFGRVKPRGKKQWKPTPPKPSKPRG